MLEIYKILNSIYDRHEGWFTPNRFAWSDEAGTMRHKWQCSALRLLSLRVSIAA